MPPEMREAYHSVENDREWLPLEPSRPVRVTHGGPTVFARIGVVQALNRHHVREFNPKE